MRGCGYERVWWEKVQWEKVQWIGAVKGRFRW